MVAITPTDRELSIGNMLIDQAQALIRSQGSQNRLQGYYRASVFQVLSACDGDSYSLEIAYGGVLVLLYRATGAQNQGDISLRPGCWQADFLSLRAANNQFGDPTIVQQSRGASMDGI